MVGGDWSLDNAWATVQRHVQQAQLDYVPALNYSRMPVGVRKRVRRTHLCSAGMPPVHKGRERRYSRG